MYFKKNKYVQTYLKHFHFSQIDSNLAKDALLPNHSKTMIENTLQKLKNQVCAPKWFFFWLNY